MTWTDRAHRIDPHILVNDEYRSKLTGYTARPAFTERLRELVRRIRPTRVGGTLLAALPRDTCIITPKENYDVDIGRSLVADDAAALVIAFDDRAATARGSRQRSSHDDPSTAVDERGLPIPGAPAGTGRGSPSVMYWGEREAVHHGFGEDGVLVHELTHVLRNAYGARTNFRVEDVPGSPWIYDNVDEFIAQSVLNMYLVELGKRPVVGHSTLAYAELRSYPLDPREAPRLIEGRAARDSVELARYRDYERRYILQFFYRAPRLRSVFASFATLSPEAVAYNPFRDAHTGRGLVLAPPRFR